MSNILLSVAIPTRNREIYLKNLIIELLASNRRDFEIVIQDNSENDSLGPWVAALNDLRIRYNYHPGWLSVVDNCDAAVLSCEGDYVCMLGDDDGILLEESLTVLAAAKRDGIDAVMGTILNYVWPDLNHHIIKGYGGRLYFKSNKGKQLSNDFKSIAYEVVKRGGAMGLQNLPCVYHGFISKSALSSLYKITGSYFPGPSPDMANAIGLCAVLRTLRRTPSVLVITGHSALSTAGAGTQRKHHGAVLEQIHLPSDTAANWFEDIPFFWSGPTIYAQSLRTALARTKNKALGTAGTACVYAACLVYHREYSDAVFKAIRFTGKGKPKLYLQIFYCQLVILTQRASNILIKLRDKLNKGEKRSIEAGSISEAIRAARKNSSTN